MRFVVAFSSPKRSEQIVEVAAAHAKALGAELVLLRIVPDPEKLGVIAQLISTDRPLDKARKQVESVARKLKERGVDARGEVRVGAVARGLVKAAEELEADLVFVGTREATRDQLFLMKKDPIVNYMVDNCSKSLFLVRNPYGSGALDDEQLSEESADEENSDEAEMG